MIAVDELTNAHSLSAHERPFLDLEFILTNAQTYPALLAFLQGEFCDENALFWTEARAYSHACGALEAALPEWSTASAYDECDAARPSTPTVTEPVHTPTPDTYRALHTEAARLKAWAQAIHVKYFIDTASQVAMPQPLVRRVQAQVRQLEAWHPTVLDDTTCVPRPPPFPLSSLYAETSRFTFDLMQSDAFPRFTRSSAFADLLARANDEQTARRDDGAV